MRHPLLAASVSVALTLMLSSCALAPGQHLRSTGSTTSVQVGDDQLELIHIRSGEDARRAALEATQLPEALTSYQPGPYRIGAGDVLYVTVWDHPELTVPAGPQQQLNAAGRLVQADGKLFYPYIGNIEAAGRTPSELRDALTQQLAHYVYAPQVDVSVLTYASQRVWVTGATRQPTTLPLTITPLTLVDAISQAGLDPTQADLSQVRLTRDDISYTIDVDQLGQVPGSAANLYLRANDRIHVPYLDRKEVVVVGEVIQPGAISFRTGGISLSQALGRARGIQQTTADADAVYVIRGADALRQRPSQVYQLQAHSPGAYALASQFELRPGDVVFVGASGVTRWSRFINQLLPFTTVISNAARTHSDFAD